MEIMFMSATVVITIVLCVVGIIKLPFKSFKEKHPNWYKAVFTLISFIVSIGLCVLDEMYILCGDIISLDFLVLVCVVLAGVFGGYSGIYEGFGLKEFVNTIKLNLKTAKELSKDKKTVEFLNKIEDIDKAIALLEERKHSKDSEV